MGGFSCRVARNTRARTAAASLLSLRRKNKAAADAHRHYRCRRCGMARRLALLAGVEVICLERVVRDDHSEAGTGLNIGPNAVKALTAIDPELAESITRASYPWRNWRISLTDGAVLFDLPLARVAEGPGWRIRWSELYRVLREAAGSS